MCFYSDCKYNCHKKCVEHVAKDCPGNTKALPSFLLGAGDSESGFRGSMEQLSQQNSMPLDGDSEDNGSELLNNVALIYDTGCKDCYK